MTAVVRATITILAVTIWSAPPGAAQTVAPAIIDPLNGLTLEQAIAEGLRGEPALRAARLEIDAAKGERQQAALRPNPAVSFEQREQVGGMDRQTSVGVDLPLDLFRRGPRMDAAARTIDATEAMVRDRERLLAGSIRERYGDVVASARRLEVIGAVLDASRTTYDLLRNRAAEGAAPPLDRDVALVDLRRLESERELAAGRVLTALTTLKQLLGRPPNAELTLREPLDVLVGGTGASARDEAAPERADIREAAANVAAAQARSRQAVQERKPEVSLFAGYMRMDQGFAQRGLGPTGLLEPIQGVFHNASGGVRVSVPVFNRAQGAIAAAQAREKAASATLTARQLAAATELAIATARVDAARRALATYSGETRALAQRNADVVRETYTLGRATLFDVLNEQRRFLEFEAAYTEALAEMFSAQTALRLAMGEIQ
jgi:cobalt-zinc-cadmium efflux system outer membrane protein